MPGETDAVETGVDIVTRGLGAVSLTLPTYWPQNPDAWFIKVEAQFKTAKITSEETQFFKVLAVLPESAAIRVREITQKANFEAGDYEKLKKRLIRGGQPSNLERLNRLGDLKNIMHKKPSENLIDLETIFHSATTEYVMPMNELMKKFWWLRSLPTTIQQTLLPVAETTTLENLVTIADQLFASSSSTDRVFAVQSEQAPRGNMSNDPPTVPLDYSEIDELALAAVSNRSRDFRNQRKDPFFCKYHAKFGDRAKRCVVGCSKYAAHSKNEVGSASSRL